MTVDDSFEAWLRANPAPDLQELVERHGGYNNITPEAWGEYDHELAGWRERRRRRLEGSEDLPHATPPETLCICGLPGVVSRERRGGGRSIWRCSQHSSCWPDYAEDLPLKGAAE